MAVKKKHEVKHVLLKITRHQSVLQGLIRYLLYQPIVFCRIEGHPATRMGALVVISRQKFQALLLYSIFLTKKQAAMCKNFH
jgi:hypothetical protein